jgi:pilus assembly protein Flp/PilA
VRECDLNIGVVADRDCEPKRRDAQTTRATFPTEESLMKSVAKNLVTFLKKEDGPTAVEYAVMLALIIVVCIAAITALGSNANNTFSYVASKTQPTVTAAS